MNVSKRALALTCKKVFGLVGIIILVIATIVGTFCGLFMLSAYLGNKYNWTSIEVCSFLFLVFIVIAIIAIFVKYLVETYKDSYMEAEFNPDKDYVFETVSNFITGRFNGSRVNKIPASKNECEALQFHLPNKKHKITLKYMDYTKQYFIQIKDLSITDLNQEIFYKYVPNEKDAVKMLEKAFVKHTICNGELR